MEEEVSKILGFRWFALSDKQFKQTNVNWASSYYLDGYKWRHCFVEFKEVSQGLSINDVTALGVVSRILWHQYLRIITKKRDDGGRSVKINQKLHDVIYGRSIPK